MAGDGLDCDIHAMLEGRDNEEFDVLQRLSTSCQEFRAKVAAYVESYLVRERDDAQKCEALKEQIAHLHVRHKEVIAEEEKTILEQKVTDKKKAIMVKKLEKFIEEIDSAKSRKESIALELVDLMQEMEDGKKARRDKWNAIRMACSIYKEKLDFHIEFTEFEDHERVQVTFFKHSNPNRDSYYVHLLNYNNHWKVGQIEPVLKDIHSEELKTFVDFTKTLVVGDVTMFLCKLRMIFSKYYLKE